MGVAVEDTTPGLATVGSRIMQSDAASVEDYLADLPADRLDAIEEVRDVILANLPDGYEECLQYGMIGYVVPLETYGDTYNGQPLGYMALASQKNHMALYMSGIYMDDALRDKFETDYKATGKRWDVGKSCVRFKKLDDLPLDVIAEAVAAIPVPRLLELHESARR